MLAKKSLGQNFLKSKETINKIIEVSNIQERDIIIEIGPGKGSLTKEILKKATEKDAILIAIEKDDRLITFLENEFKEHLNKSFILLHQDILNFETSNILNYISNKNKYINSNIKIIANIPYYITGSIIKKFVDENIVNSMTILLQKEVADRIVCKDNKSSILSLAIKSFGEAKYIKKVDAKYFNPKPKVDSAVIYIKKHNYILFENKKTEELYFEIIKNGLQFKRKTLFNNLKELLKTNNVSEEAFKKILSNISINNPNIRGEDIDFDKWILLTKQIQKEQNIK